MPTSDSSRSELPGYTIEIGGLAFDVRSTHPDLSVGPGGQTRRFLVQEASGRPEDRFEVDATIGSLSPGSRSEELYRAESWKLHRDARGMLSFEAWSAHYEQHPIRRASLDLEAAKIIAAVHDLDELRGKTLDPMEFPIDELLMINILPDREAIEVHGCGAIVDGRGYLFAGVSGAGKTTTAGLIQRRHPDAVILSDDRIIVRRVGGEQRMYGTPWHGEAELSAARSVPLERILLLSQADETRIERISIGEAISRLLTCTFVPFYLKEKMELSLTTLGRICEERTPELFHFQRDPSALGVVFD